MTAPGVGGGAAAEGPGRIRLQWSFVPTEHQDMATVPKPTPPSLIDELKALLGDRLSTAAAVRGT